MRGILQGSDTGDNFGPSKSPEGSPSRSPGRDYSVELREGVNEVDSLERAAGKPLL